MRLLVLLCFERIIVFLVRVVFLTFLVSLSLVMLAQSLVFLKFLLYVCVYL